MNDRSCDRRSFLKALGFGVVAGTAGVYLPGCGQQINGLSCSSNSEVIRFGLCADVHKDIMHDADARLQAFIDRANAEKLDFIMQLGDFCRPYDYNRPFLNIFNQFSGPKYHVIGNHDMDGGFKREQVVDFWGAKARYYSFDREGYHFVVLDGNDKKANRAPGYPRYIGPEQQAWLAEDLKNNTLPVLIFSHQGFGPAGDIENAGEIRTLIERENTCSQTGNVVACFNGHDHIDASIERNGVHYIQINSMSYYWMSSQCKIARYDKEIEKKYPWLCCTAPYEGPLYAIVSILADGSIKVEGVRSQWVEPAPTAENTPANIWQRAQYATPVVSDRVLKP